MIAIDIGWLPLLVFRARDQSYRGTGTKKLQPVRGHHNYAVELLPRHARLGHATNDPTTSEGNLKQD